MAQFLQGKDDGSSLRVLRLHTWKDEALPVSYFDQASLSPSRDTLLLQSKQCEAMLVSVRSTKVSENAVSVMFTSAAPPPPPPPHPGPADPAPSDASLHSTAEPSSNSGSENSPLVDGSAAANGAALPRSPLLQSRKHPFIMDCISFCWGCSAEGYSADKQVGTFKELLIVVAKNGLFVHGFPKTTENQSIDSATDRGGTTNMEGRWINWGSESWDLVNSRGEGQSVHVNDGRLTKEEENGFITFLTDARVQKHADGLLLNFVDGSIQPSVGKLHSYGILYDSTAFSDLVDYCEKYFGKDKENDLTMQQGEGSSQMLVDSVFSGPSFNLVGVLLYTKNNSTDGYKEASRFCILVCKVLQSGLEWFSVVQPGKASTNSAISNWPTFALTGDHLYGLHENGLIYIWSLGDASVVAQIDILEHCGINHLSKLEDMGVPEDPTDAGGSGLQKKNDNVRPVKTFKNMVVAADSSMIGLTDSESLVYLVSTDGYLPHLRTLEAGPYCSRRLSSWAIGSRHIGSTSHKLPLVDTVSHKTSIRKQPTGAAKAGGFFDENSASGLSGFASKARLARRERSKAGFSNCYSRPVKRIFLPLDRCSTILSLCVNSFGIMQVAYLNKRPQECLAVAKMACLSGEVSDDRSSNAMSHAQLSYTPGGVFLPFCSQGYLHFISEDGLSVILPPLFAGPSKWAGGLRDQWWFTGHNLKTSDLELGSDAYNAEPWLAQGGFELLDKALIYDGLVEAERLVAENGWSQHVVRLRRLQVALEYLQLDEIEEALEGLIAVKGAESGVPRVLFTAVELMLNHSSGDNELAQASRLLSLATCFATKLIAEYGVRDWGRRRSKSWLRFSKKSSFPTKLENCANKLHEMSQFLEVTRKLQLQLRSRRSRPQAGKNEMGDDCAADILAENGQANEPFERQSGTAEVHPSNNAVGFFKSEDSMWLVRSGENKTLISSGEMFHRWEKENMNISMIVREALRAGRLPLAVAQLHRLEATDLVYHPPTHDTFKRVQGIGRAFVYELFCKGETVNALIALSRLGEDVGTVLRELAFGTVSRFLRSQVFKELARLGCLNSQDFQRFETISNLERAYPNNSFWGSYGAQQRLLPGLSGSSTESPSSDVDLHLICSLGEPPHDLTIACGEIDGVVLGNWNSLKISMPPHISCEELAPGYWAGAAVWLDAWDKNTLDRVYVDQETLLIDSISWEASLQAAISCFDWTEASSLLDSIPESVLREGELQVRLDCPDSPFSFSSALDDEAKVEETKLQDGVVDGLDVDAVEAVIPKVKFLDVALGNVCTGWIRQKIEEKLVENGIFLRSYWNGTGELITLLARAGLLLNTSSNAEYNNGAEVEKIVKLHKETEQAIHELVLRHCVRFSLPNLMTIYLDHHSLALDAMSSIVLQAVVGDCQWALWLLLSRIKGREYDASFANARTVLAHNFKPGQLSASDIDEFISTVDDMAMAGGEIMAICTLMYAPLALERCLSIGSVNRFDGPSSQCTLENLRPVLQQYPTLWRTLVAACFTPDTWCFVTSSPPRAARRKPGLAGYLQWREQIFSSACGDTSILQMMPRWFPKGVQRLLQLSVQGPVGGGQGVSGAEHSMHHPGLTLGEGDPIAWETALKQSIEGELYASSKLEGKAVGVEHHLRRGRAMAAFNSLLATRLQNLNAQGSLIREHVGKFQKGQLHMSSELHALLSPLIVHEEKHLASVLPLAVMNFENSVVVASCATLLELCGLPATMLRVDVAALCRIASFCKANDTPDSQGEWSSTYANDVAASLARALADEYMETGVAILTSKKMDTPGNHVPSRKITKVLMEVLQILEKASFTEWRQPDVSSGSWLMNGTGDGFQLRSQQRESSERWSLVTTFCNIHQLPISTAYLTALARDNDWVGFLAEAQSEGCSLDVLTSVASKEFTDSRLQSHIMTVLKSSQAAWHKPSVSPPAFVPNSRQDSYSVSNSAPPSELFEILAECEREKHSGTALLTKAKDLRWPLLAVVASCFTDVTPVSCLTVWLEITAARETSSIKVSDAAAHIAACVGAAVEATNALPDSSHVIGFQYNRKSSKRRRLSLPEKFEPDVGSTSSTHTGTKEAAPSVQNSSKAEASPSERKGFDTGHKLPRPQSGTSVYGGREEQESLSRMIAILCEQQRYFPLLKAFELFMPSSSLLPFIRFLQAFSQMRLSDASAHLTLFSARLKDESHQAQHGQNRVNKIPTGWITLAAVTAANTMLKACPSVYERRCLLQLLAGADFGDGGAAALRFRRLFWKVQLAEPALRQNSADSVDTAVSTDLEDDELLLVLEKQGKWEDARSWARQLELSGQNRKAVHHVTETQAEVMVAEWREFLWDLPEERVALWNHCQALFLRHSFPAQQAGSFFLKYAEKMEQEIPPSELHAILLLALQWLSGSFTNSPPSYPVQQLRDLETKIWLLAVESQVELQQDQGQKPAPPKSLVEPSRLGHDVIGSSTIQLDPINLTAKSVSLVDIHIKNKSAEPSSSDQESAAQGRPSINQDHLSLSVASGPTSKMKRKPRNYAQHKKVQADKPPKPPLETDQNTQAGVIPVQKVEPKVNNRLQEDAKEEAFVSSEDQLYWEERVSEQELERAVLSLLEVGQVSAARQLQQKSPPVQPPIELLLVEAALDVAKLSSTPTAKGRITPSNLHPSVAKLLLSSSLIGDISSATPFEILEAITEACREGCGRGSCKRIAAVARIANFLELSFLEAFDQEPTQLLQLLSLKAQDSLPEAKLLVETHSMLAASTAKILAESFLKGLLAAHRGGYMESSHPEEGPSPLLWRPSDFLKWAELCQSEPEMGHALMRLVISGHEVPHACEVELLVRAHHFYMSSASLDAIDVLLGLAATRVDSYFSEGDFTSLARLVTGINNFQSLHFMLDILIENGQLELLLKKRAVVEAAMESSASVRGFRMAVLSTLKHFNPHDLDAFAMVYNQFDMKHEMAALVESRAHKGLEQWVSHHDPEQSEELLEMMRYNVEAAEVWAGVDAGNKARWNCAQASLISLQLRIPELTWLNLSETNARRLFVEQSRFQEALVVAEAYNLNQPGEWVPVLWNQMPNPGWVDQFLGEFVAALPLPPSMLMELARFYRSEVTARGDQIDFSSWLTPGGLPFEWAKYLGKSFRCLLKYVRDVRLRVQLATLATGFPDVLDVCMRILDKVPDTAGPLILRKGHGGGYLPLM